MHRYESRVVNTLLAVAVAVAVQVLHSVHHVML